MNQQLCVLAVASLVLSSSIQTLAQHPSMPAGMTHDEHLAQLQKEAEMKQRGAAAMGFDQDEVIHHFLVMVDGGAIEVEAKDPAQTANRDAIRTHLRQIASAFANGDFGAPFVTHAEVPPGVSTMQELKPVITYSFSETATGGRVRIATAHKKALTAVHEFLRYQIQEHHTGDPLTAK